VDGAVVGSVIAVLFTEVLAIVDPTAVEAVTIVDSAVMGAVTIVDPAVVEAVPIVDSAVVEVVTTVDTEIIVAVTGVDSDVKSVKKLDENSMRAVVSVCWMFETHVPMLLLQKEFSVQAHSSYVALPEV